MACADESKEINGRSYYVVQMAPTKAIPIQLKLTKIFGSSLGKLGSVMRGNFKDQAEALGGAVTALFENSSEEEIFALIKTVVETAKVDGKPINFDVAFQGEHLVDVYKVFFWVLGVNFSSFFGGSGLNGFLEKAKAQFENVLADEAKEKKQPQTSTAISGSP